MLQKKIIQAEETVFKYPYENNPIENQLTNIFKLWQRTQNAKNKILEKKQVYWVRGFLECFYDTPRGLTIICNNVLEDPHYFLTTQTDFANFIKWLERIIAIPLNPDSNEISCFPPTQLIRALKEYLTVIEDYQKPPKPILAPVIFHITPKDPVDPKTNREIYRALFMVNHEF